MNNLLAISECACSQVQNNSSPSVTDWMMVVITVVYVIATIAICFANFSSANAAKKQLEEMKKQYAEENRPNIQVELAFERRAFYILRFVNHGKITAQNVQITLSDDFFDGIKGTNFYTLLKKQSGKNCVIGIGQKYDIVFADDSTDKKIPISGKITYEANGQTYNNDFCINFENYAAIFSVNSEQYDFLQEIKKQNKELNEINKSLKNLISVISENKNNE